jgi:hypothetical protein
MSVENLTDVLGVFKTLIWFEHYVGRETHHLCHAKRIYTSETKSKQARADTDILDSLRERAEFGHYGP